MEVQKYCTKCGYPVEEGAVFCTHCGKKLTDSIVCPHCNGPVSPSDTVCPSCGQSLKNEETGAFVGVASQKEEKPGTLALTRDSTIALIFALCSFLFSPLAIVGLVFAIKAGRKDHCSQAALFISIFAIILFVCQAIYASMVFNDMMKEMEEELATAIRLFTPYF